MSNRILLSIVIPCLNESRTVGLCVNDALKFGAKYLKNNFEVVVADNGSTDGSVEIVKLIKGVKLVKVPVRGYGAALHWGILKSRGEYVMFGDADMSYPFSNLRVMHPLISQSPDLILGSRLRGKIADGAMPFLHRYLGTPLLTHLINWLYKINSSDCNSGMRIVRRSFYKELNMRNSGMEWASELLLKTALKKGKYLEVPIRFLKDKRNRPPHLSTWSDGWRHLKAIFLLKPVSLFYFFLASICMAYIVYGRSFSLTIFFLLQSVVIVLSYLALRYLEFAIEKKHNFISQILNSNKLVVWVIMITIAIGGIVIMLPDSRLGTKLFMVAVNSLLFIWVFLVETVKTHMINRLPNDENI